jgi:hypothetical protein
VRKKADKDKLSLINQLTRKKIALKRIKKKHKETPKERMLANFH